MVTARTFLAIIAAIFGLLLSVPIIVLGLPFWVVAFLTRAIARRLEPQILPWQQVIEFDPSLGWKSKANLDTNCLADYDDIFHLTTDSQGWPGKTTIAESEIVVFGDSYAFSYGVDPEAFFADLNPKLRIKAIGAIGYNLVQELLLMRQLSPQLKDKLVVWFIFYGNDLYDNLSPEMFRYRMPFIRQVDGTGVWEVVTSHISPTNWVCSSGRVGEFHFPVLAALHSPTPLSQRAYAGCEFLIKEGNHICSQAGARLMLLTLPSPMTLSRRGLEQLSLHSAHPPSIDPYLPDKEIGNICRKLGVPFVAGKDFLSVKDYKRYNDHWNERGHQRVAEILHRYYREYISGKMQWTQIETYGQKTKNLEVLQGKKSVGTAT